MQARYIQGLTIRPLRHGDTETVAAVFARLGSVSRQRRFCGAKPRLSNDDLTALARVDETHHVLVAYVDGDASPAGIARLVRDGGRGEIAFEVADTLQGRGIGSVLARELAADARAAGVTQLVALLGRLARSVDVRWHDGEREFVVSLAEPAASPS